METTIRIIILVFMIHSTDSNNKIISFANGTDFLEGSPAALTCVFPPNPTEFSRLQWDNKPDSITLRCKNLTNCQQRSGFEVSRSGYNITLIIKHVKLNQNKWSCSDHTTHYIEYVNFNVIVPPPGQPNITMKSSKIFVGEQLTIACEWQGGHPSASVTLNCLSVTKTDNDSVTITGNVTREMSDNCRCEGVHITGNASTTFKITIEERAVNIWLIVGPTIAALLIIIAGVIIWIKYRGYSKKKNISEGRNPKKISEGGNPPTAPKLEGGQTENIYHTVEIQPKEGGQTENMNHTVEIQPKENDPARRIYVNSAMPQTD